MTDKEASSANSKSPNKGLEGSCAVCELKTTLRCQGCVQSGKDAKDIPFYCSKEHQISHWKSSHKANCGKSLDQGWKVIRTVGKNFDLPYFETTKDLKPGHVLFTKMHLLSLPKVASDQDAVIWCKAFPQVANQVRLSAKRLLWTCISCYEMMLYGELLQDPLHGLRMNKCADCGWPVHSNVIPRQPLSDCQEMHAEECKILKANGLRWENLVDSEDQYLYYYLGLLRSVLLPAELRAEFLKLPIFKPELYSKIMNSDKMIHFVRYKCKLADKVSEQELQKSLLIIFSNILGPSDYYSIRKKIAFSIYRGGPTGRILPHDCTPNCDFYVNPETLGVTFKTIREVGKKEMLTINYSAGHFYVPIYDRILMYAQLFMNQCQCRRCTTPTEDATYLSAIRCSAEKKKKSKVKKDCQFLVPMPKPPGQSTGMNDMFFWKCMCGACAGATRQEVVKQLTDMITGEIARAAAKNNYAELKSIMKKYSEDFVHPKNSVMVFALMNLAALAYNQVKNFDLCQRPGFRFDLHKKFLADFDNVLEVYDVVLPGRNEKRGLFLFGQAILKVSELAEKISKSETVPSKDDLTKELETIMKNVKESWIIAKENPFRESTDRYDELAVQKLYANHFAKAIKKVADLKELPVVKLFCEKYCDENVQRFWQEWQSNPPNWIIIPAKQLPKLLKKIEEEG